jgi:hypothetical protein
MKTNQYLKFRIEGHLFWNFFFTHNLWSNIFSCSTLLKKYFKLFPEV